VAFYEALGYERRGKLQFETAYNIYMGLPDDPDTLELTVNIGREEPYDLGDGYNHIALTVDDLDAQLAELAKVGVEPEKPPFAPGGRPEIGRICFVQDPDGYRIELIDGGEFKTPQDP
jgi:lactoylglutathione lyase